MRLGAGRASIVQPVTVSSDLLGELPTPDDRVLELPDGLLGFAGPQRFVMVEHPDTTGYWWLQSLEDSALTFLAVMPWIFFPDYEAVVSEEHEASLELRDPSDALVLCLVSVRDHPDESGADVSTGAPNGTGEAPDVLSVTTNLLGPIIINQRTRRGAQIVLDDDRWSVRAPLGGG